MSGNQTAHRSRGRPWLAVVGGGVLLVILLGLGTWQVQRLHWKEGLLARIDERIHSEPVDLAAIQARAAEGGDIEYRPVTVEGTYRHASERHFLATWQGKSGFNVYTPLRLEDGRWLFVNRGFVPYDRKDPATRPEGQVEGPVSVTGLARRAPKEKPSFIVPENDPAGNVFYWKDLDAMAASAGLPEDARIVPLFVDADDASNLGGLPVGGVTLINLPNSHLQYAVTWYGLAAALVVILFLRLWRERKEKRPEAS